jgi:hypothetical protein
MLIFVRGQTAVDVNILLPSMLIFSLLVTGPEKNVQKILRLRSQLMDLSQQEWLWVRKVIIETFFK